ncbi:MAG: hypothetical protein K8H75_08815 [Sulfuricella sp.]|nr:hypothetical protein [Sulfuricella sp.]
MPIRNIRDFYRLRGYYPGPLSYPFTPLWGNIPVPVLDRLSFRAIESQCSGDSLGVFMVRAWEHFRYPHMSMLHALLDMGLVRRVFLSTGQESWEWSIRALQSTARSGARTDTLQGANNGFFDVSKISEFSSSVVVAPRISSMGAPVP